MADLDATAGPVPTGPGDPPSRLDVVLARVAAHRPDAPALVVPGGAVTFRTLDRQVDRFAATVTDTLARAGAPPTGSVVAVAAALCPDFAVAYYGVLRSGNIVTPVVPLLAPRGLAHVLGTGGARVAVVTPAVRARIERVAGGLPDLAAVLDLGMPGGDGPPAAPPAPGTDGLDAPACIQFTSGTTGAPKAVLLSHRNIAVNAFQTARAHRLDATSVAANHLPTFHPMHLNAAMVAGSTQVLCTVEDPADAVRTAADHGATHLYSLPVRLARLAEHPDLAALQAPSIRVVASGGSALAPALAGRLARRLGVPVVQGYGLAETSPLTHFDPPERARPGSVGPPVAGTECRVVDVERRTPVAVGHVGEVQVRGPQLMVGYLDAEPGADLDEGWFSTGDVGRVDADGWLYLVDRIKDVFKHDNWLVSPTAVERTLLDRPEIADCCVVDRHDGEHGGVAHAFVVPAAGIPLEALGAGIDAVNDEAPYYERVSSFDATPAVLRSPQGKVPRAELRARLAQGRPAVSPFHPLREGGPTVVTMVNKFTVFGDTDEFERVWLESSDFMRQQSGFRNFQLLRSVMDPLVYINIAEWETVEDHQRVLQGADFQSHIKELAKVATPDPNLCTTVTEAAADGRQ